MNGAAPPPPTTIKDTIDANSGRFEFLKQTLTLGLAGIGGVAALFTDPSRVPSDTLSKWVLVLAGAGLLFVVAFAVMGLSAYANLLTVTAKVPQNPDDVDKYSKGVRGHARVVIIALSLALAGTVTFAVNRLFAPATTPDGALTTAAGFVAKETGLTSDRIHFDKIETDSDAYVVMFTVPTTGNAFTVRVAKKDGAVSQASQQKKP
ncbi:hypothetical protein [Bradyrhizobium sp. WYCCWR 12699]|uniref:hypothetical protein n=1 Tax=Bradyrhizobium sp. WYCCWR 12699 TaxID=3064203 RepID=UPI0028A47DB0|nr:hypothetical protein [Bradyrhizobium sp. WYCCWR 12699]MDT4738437.1 hypothetical protein [Bradyrhizobium sp. WYCCWR 12699]